MLAKFPVSFSEEISSGLKSFNKWKRIRFAFLTFNLASTYQMFILRGQVFSIFLFGVVYWVHTIHNKQTTGLTLNGSTTVKADIRTYKPVMIRRTLSLAFAGQWFLESKTKLPLSKLCLIDLELKRAFWLVQKKSFVTYLISNHGIFFVFATKVSG